MAFLNDAALDALLTYIKTNAESLYICSQQPTTYLEASDTYALAHKGGPTLSAIADADGGGRKITVSLIGLGYVVDDGIGTHWALVRNTGPSLIVASAALANPQYLTDGNPFAISAFDITVKDAILVV